MVFHDQIFSPNILPYEQMFGRLTTSANRLARAKKVTNQKWNLGDVNVSFQR